MVCEEQSGFRSRRVSVDQVFTKTGVWKVSDKGKKVFIELLWI